MYYVGFNHCPADDAQHHREAAYSATVKLGSRPAWPTSGASLSLLGECSTFTCRAMDVHASQGSAIAEQAIRRIAELYAVEKQLRGKSPEERVWSTPDNPLMIWRRLHVQLPKISGKSPLAQAIRYALGRLPKARPYLENG